MIGATAPEKAGHVQNPPSLRYEVTPCISMGDFSSAVSPYIYSLWIISLSSRNPDYHIIRYQCTHRSYSTPRRLQQIKLRDNPYWDFCPDITIATFYHMVWQCPEINKFWHNVSSIMSSIIEGAIPHSVFAST